MKSFEKKTIEEIKSKLKDLQVVGNVNDWKLFSRIATETGKFKDSVKVLEVPGGVVMRNEISEVGFNSILSNILLVLLR